MKKTICACILIATQLTQGFSWWSDIRVNQPNNTYTYKNSIELRLQGDSYTFSPLPAKKSTLDDVGRFAKKLFEKYVKSDFAEDNVSVTTFTLWLFCMDVTLEQASRYIADAGGVQNLETDWRNQTDSFSKLKSLQLDSETREILKDWRALYATRIVQNADEIKKALVKEKRILLKEDLEDIVDNSVTFKYRWTSDLKEWPEVPYFANDPRWGVPLACVAGSVASGMVVYGGGIALTFKASITAGTSLGTFLAPGVGTAIGMAGGAIVGGGLAAWLYFVKYGETYNVTLSTAEEELANWGDTQEQRENCLKDVLEHYAELKEQLQTIHAPINKLEHLTTKPYEERPSFAKVLSKKDWKKWCSNMKDRLSTLQSTYEETLAHLEDCYINYPLLVAYSEAIAGCEFLSTAKSKEYFAERKRDELDKIEHSLIQGIESLKECHDMAFKYSTSPLCLSTVNRYNNTYCYSMIQSERPKDLSDKKKLSHWIDDITKRHIPLADNEKERIEKGILNVVVEPRTYFDLMELYKLLGTKENENWQALFLAYPPEGISREAWMEHIETWKHAMARWCKEAFGGNTKALEDPAGIYAHWQTYKQCPPAFTLKALQRNSPKEIKDGALFAQLVALVGECKNLDQIPICLKTWTLSENCLLHLQALPYKVNEKGEILMNEPLDFEDELPEYLQQILQAIKQERGMEREKRPWWKFF